MLHVDLIAPIATLLDRHAKQRPEKVAYSDSSREVTYAALAERTAAIAANLARAGLKEGDKIAIYLPNGVDWIEACFAALRAGAVVVPISFDAAEGEISYRLTDAGCSLVITAAARKELIGRICRDAEISPTVIFAGSDAAKAGMALADLATGSATKPLDPDDIDRSSFIIYTSGTTGRAKGVLLSLRGMLWIAASCWAPICELTEKDIVLSPLPLFHSYGLNLSVLSVLAVGASEHIMERFSPQQALDLLQTGKYSVLPGVPTMFHYLLHRARETGIERLGSVRLCISAGAIMPATLNTAFEERFKTRLLDGYGITETSTMVTMNWLQRRPADGVVRAAGARPCRAHRRSVVAGGCSDRRGGRTDRARTEPDARLSQQACGNRVRAAQGLVPHGRSRQVGRQRVSHDHRPDQGADHPRRPEHRAGRDRGSRGAASAGDGLRGRRHHACDARRSALSVCRGQGQ